MVGILQKLQSYYTRVRYAVILIRLMFKKQFAQQKQIILDLEIFNDNLYLS